jgi:hypothetical protein
MPQLVVSEGSGASDLAPLALAFNQIISLPVTIRGQSSPGVRVEKGAVLDEHYTGPVLEKVLRSGKPIRTIPDRGVYKGVPVSVAPITASGKVVAAMGVVDLTGTVDLPEVFGAYADILRQVKESK